MAVAETAMRGNFLAWQNSFPRVVIHHAMHKFLVLPREKLRGAMLKVPCVCEVINGVYCTLRGRIKAKKCAV